MPGLVGPDSYPIRKPEQEDRIIGRNVNPVRYPEMGGFDGASAWMRGDTSKTNPFSVEKPTNVRAARSTTGKNED
jgi:hypothetical protein